MLGLQFNCRPNISVIRVDAVKSARIIHVGGAMSETCPNNSPSDLRLSDSFIAVAEGVDDFVCLATSHGEPFYLNAAGRRMLGLSERQELSATNLHAFYDPETWEQLRDTAVPAVNKSGQWKGACRLQNLQTGRFIDVQTTMLRVKSPESNRPTILAIIHREHNDNAQLEQALAEAESRKHAILESSLDPIITINHEGVITEFNRAAEQIFGYPRDKIIGTKPADVLFSPNLAAGEQDRIERYLNAGEGSLLGRRVEFTAVRANGESFPAEMAMTISQEHGAPVMSFFFRDISARKKAEMEQIRHAAELERSNSELEQFAYVASHDLQEPLRKIRTFSDRLLLKQAEQLDDDGKDCLHRMHNAAARMQSLIDGLLALSRVTTKSQKFEKCDLARVAAEVVSDLEVQIKRSGGRVEVDKLPAIQADPLQMHQLFQNLIANALKFHRQDEPPVVKVSGRYIPTREDRKTERLKSEQCRIVVEDNGIGFDEKYCSRIFGIFQRLHPRDVYEGTGIGLAICRRIVEQHGGTITARSVAGKGSMFEVLLPVVAPKKALENDSIHKTEE
jgi:two-component system, LuxR family, sensor kinase FixL